MPQNLVKPIGQLQSGKELPLIGSRTWRLVLDRPQDTNNEEFFYIQVFFTGTGIVPQVAVTVPYKEGTVNPVFVPFNGAIIPVRGIGYQQSGQDKYGRPAATDIAAVTEVIAFGGDTIATR